MCSPVPPVMRSLCDIDTPYHYEVVFVRILRGTNKRSAHVEGEEKPLARQVPQLDHCIAHDTRQVNTILQKPNPSHSLAFGWKPGRVPTGADLRASDGGRIDVFTARPL